MSGAVPTPPIGAPRAPLQSPAALTLPWHLPPQGLAVFHGECDAPRLSHYFLPRLVREGKQILFLDGANCANPRLMARLAERRGIPFAEFNRHVRLARAFTCFQLTELVRRVPRFLAESSAQVLIVTAFPELYFDEDVRDADARAAFQQALADLRGWAGDGRGWELGAGAQDRNSKFETRNSASGSRVSNFDFRVSAFPQLLAPVTVALFSCAANFQPPAARKPFFAQIRAAATELWKFQVDEQQLRLLRQDTALLEARG